MRSQIRQDGTRALEDARIRRSALLAATAQDLARGANGLDAALCRRMAALPRMQARLFERITEAAGDPAACGDVLRRFLLLPSDARKEAALRAGLTYHLNAFGTAFARDIVEALSGVFGKGAVRFALAHAAMPKGCAGRRRVSPPRPPRREKRSSTWRALLRRSCSRPSLE
ncbi:hypothetical protein [Sinorhizobium meliloti]|uniref:hypothetical protein n=1 Tax=Rhizobium meliloti TaxID=382 RepID=UPI0012FDD1FE|nr:hypothetical protein [Sinorhizobium meliloti]